MEKEKEKGSAWRGESIKPLVLGELVSSDDKRGTFNGDKASRHPTANDKNVTPFNGR